MKRLDIIPLIKEKGLGSENLYRLIVEEIIRHDALDSEKIEMKELLQTVNKFLHKVREKLNKCNRMYDRFLRDRE